MFAKIDFEKVFYKLLSNAFYGKTMKIIRRRVKIEIIKKDDTEKTKKKQQSKLTFNGIHYYYTNYDNYKFKQNEVLMDKPIYLGFAELDFSKIITYQTYYDKLQPRFGQENFQLHYMDTNSFELSVNTKDIIKDLKNLEEFLDFRNLSENHELLSNKIQKLLENLKQKLLKIFR